MIKFIDKLALDSGTVGQNSQYKKLVEECFQ
jgi:hypothetical protein